MCCERQAEASAAGVVMGEPRSYPRRKIDGEGPMRFILVHGGFHGAWCWDRVVPELEKLGHEALALDLPGHGARAAERPVDYRGRIQPILDVLRQGDVLVGH